MSPLQDYQVGSNDLISAMFQRRFEPNFAWVNAAGALQMLPQLRGAWLMTSVDANGDVTDLSGQGHTLINQSSTPFGVYGLASYGDLDGVADYFRVVNHVEFQITGALSLGGWFWADSLAADRALMSKSTAAGNQRSYVLSILTTGAPQAMVSSDGTATKTVAGTAGDVVISGWYFLAMRYTPSTELAVWVNKTKYVNTTAIPASIFNCNANFKVGGVNGGASLDGRASLSFICAAALSNAMIGAIYEQTRALFGVGVTA